MKRVLVTGASGFIGSTLVDRLLRDGDVEIRAVDSFTDYYPREIKESNLADARAKGIEFVEADLTTGDIAPLLDGIDTVFHLAGQPGVRPSWGETFNRYIDWNVSVTQRLLEAARESTSLERFVNASSSSVYGDAEAYPTHEAMRPQPRSPYGVTKLAAENLGVLYAANFGVPTVALRFFTVYGPRQRPDMAFTRFLFKAVTGTPITIYGNGEQIRDFTFVEDIVSANVAAATAEGVAPGSVFNVSGGSSHSVNEALGMISEIVGGDLAVDYREVATGDVFRTGGDGSAARDALSWAPTVGLFEGLTRHAAWVRDHVDALENVIR